MASSQGERRLQSAVIKYLNAKKDSFCVDHYSGGVPACARGNRIIYKKQVHKVNGFPDLIWIFRGSVYFVELKMPKGVVSKDQKLCHARIEECGGRVLIWRSFQECIDFISSP